MSLDSVDRQLVRLIRAPSGEGAPVAWNAVADRAVRTRLAPLLHLALASTAGSPRPPRPIAERLRSEYFQATLANAILGKEAARLLGVFHRAAIPLVLLKGIALIHSLYEDAGARPLGDLDLLVHAADLARARETMLASGYEVAPDLADGFRDEFESEQVFRRQEEPRISVDVHRHLFNVPHIRESVALDWFWANTTSIRIGEHDGTMFAPGAQLLHLSGHYAYNHQAEGLRWLYDIDLLVARHQGEIPWEAALGTAGRVGLGPAVELALTRASEVWGTPLGDAPRGVLALHRPALRERLAFAALTAPQHRARIFLDAWSMPGWRGTLTYLGRSLVPERSYMMKRYGIRDERLLPLFYVRRLGYGAWLLLRSAGSMVGSVGSSLVRAVFRGGDSQLP
jgi:hypothetical protein